FRKNGYNVFVQDLDDSVGCWLSDDKLKTKYHCSCRSLYAITEMIKYHNIFKKGRQGPQQTPVEFQLMVLLSFIGHESQTDEQRQNTFFIGCRTARLFRKHVGIVQV
ncbi:hypothetical protein ACHAXS_001997, partial [Conticribra weissflogii]